MRVLIAGVDGYLGWPLAQHLAVHGHEVGGADLLLRREWVAEMGSRSATPIAEMPVRLNAFKARFGKELRYWQGDLRDYPFVEQVVREFQPDAIVHLGECPSPAYSMIDVQHATFVQTNNIITTFNLLFALRDHAPEAHLVKLGTMGEYGTPNIDIAEGFFEIEYRGRKDRLPFPRQAGSWYHASKVHGSNNVMLACKLWQLPATDVMQGVVYGSRSDEMATDDRLLTRLDFDQAFGTAINRFCCQAVVGHALTPYGRGHQKRGFIPLRDSMQCLRLALENPPARGEYRVLNQFEEVYGITELATKVVRVAQTLGIDATVANLENPRTEAEEHYYQPDHERLFQLGYRPTHDMERELGVMFGDVQRFADRIAEKRHLLVPDVHWSGRRARVSTLPTQQPVP